MAKNKYCMCSTYCRVHAEKQICLRLGGVMPKYQVDVIIPAWNERRIIKDTLESLNIILKSNHDCKIIIVAGGTDGTYEYVKDYIDTQRVCLLF